MPDKLHTVLLFALPASGKSEVRTYLASESFRARLVGHSPIGETLQLDDYPYVHVMHVIDEELKARGRSRVFFRGPDRPFIDPYDAGTLVHLLNEDYDAVLAQREVHSEQAAQLLMGRLDRARARVGLDEVLGELPYRLRCEIAAVLERTARRMLGERNRQCSQGLAGKTIFIEAARGGPNGAAMPLAPPHGYAYALAQLDERILDNAVILYVWVEPEQSRAKNVARGQPDAQGSILHHVVPLEVMIDGYGCDDMEHLLASSGRPDCVRVDRRYVETGPDGQLVGSVRTWYLPTARFDNRQDLTTFVHAKDGESWPEDAVERIHTELFRTLEILRRGWG